MTSSDPVDPVIFEQFRNINVPDIIRKIFFYLDYDSFKMCQGVSKSWRDLLTSDLFVRRGKLVFREVLADLGKELHDRARMGDDERVNQLLSCSMIDVNCVHGRLQSTPLYVAAQESHLEIVQALLAKGALPNKTAVRGMTPLQCAAFRGVEEIVQVLLDGGADLNLTSATSGTTPLHCASLNGHLNVVRVLLDQGSEPNKQAGRGNTSLHYAALRGHREVVRLLLDKGADSDLANENGLTALHIAISNCHEGVMKLLIEQGADTNKMNNSGETPGQLWLRAQYGI